ncbi:MAG: tetraacyldisaccharide 4'-kinase [bacterium (Candidatus Ratteibacteria) CG_4_10_14_3_um_filter_41_18]|uniref:Tetraacyldisaccharide 4'-kinase n=4 Tax=Candidatus Ratteibacteria TaxID=2979319 RepID=A0A2M7E8F8_9BACT|nr:MAG: tetraacyldisaccharide 4'-kinase [bacterium (Candidatus Ratteibacteria) CG01_land_8_20_14_3_00_40_19]PIW34074.1 MAG: tetraacyldisaccharide 4'-kinase [bacterium (Candidatus Ratteibacteria) CG15_BIG_FIL_POST_REV_8_21_14_020_41_12]PIX77943.1 MAG: tetraacyldisaccharide 4'-kinase [bacterium (Candidatus Ratteibacteria) CG_4_10_14_3_um_filter_41_18]HCG76976.1 tetraacyldisaccharide 4'-kinase [bacterium]
MGYYKKMKKIGFFSVFLVLFSFLYRFIIEVRNFLFQHRIFLKSIKLNSFLISVGNITAGGTGKTPVVMFLARKLQSQGKGLAVVARGYKRKGGGFLVSNRREILMGSKEAGDEANLLAENLKGIPILVGRNRKMLSQVALNNFKVDTIILDDGFHYRYLKKDLEIVVIDATNPFSNGKLLPAGLLREPLSSLKRADCFWLNYVNLVDEERLNSLKKFLTKINPEAKIVESFYQPLSLIDSSGKIYELSAISGKEVWLLAGIGNPSTFENLARHLGVKIIGKSFFPDHYWYKERNLKKILKEEFEILLTTEKDLVRLKDIPFSKPILALRIEIKVKNEENLWRNLKIK